VLNTFRNDQEKRMERRLSFLLRISFSEEEKEKLTAKKSCRKTLWQ